MKKDAIAEDLDVSVRHPRFDPLPRQRIRRRIPCPGHMDVTVLADLGRKPSSGDERIRGQGSETVPLHLEHLAREALRRAVDAFVRDPDGPIGEPGREFRLVRKLTALHRLLHVSHARLGLALVGRRDGAARIADEVVVPREVEELALVFAAAHLVIDDGGTHVVELHVGRDSAKPGEHPLQAIKERHHLLVWRETDKDSTAV